MRLPLSGSFVASFSDRLTLPVSAVFRMGLDALDRDQKDLSGEFGGATAPLSCSRVKQSPLPFQQNRHSFRTQMVLWEIPHISLVTRTLYTSNQTQSLLYH